MIMVDMDVLYELNLGNIIYIYDEQMQIIGKVVELIEEQNNWNYERKRNTKIYKP